MTSPVVIPYDTLLRKKNDPVITELIKTAFGSHETALGFLLISDLPAHFQEKCSRLLKFAYEFASLPVEIRELHASPGTTYSFGWSCGKEKFNGVPDTLKGSYYNNPDLEVEQNVWPEDILNGDSEEMKKAKLKIEGFKAAWQELCEFIVQVGMNLAVACDQLVEENNDGRKGIKQLIEESRNSKARLLHYFPQKEIKLENEIEEPVPVEEVPIPDDTWCGTHIDHSILTGLCPGMFFFTPSGINASPLEIPSPSQQAGLWIKTRAGKTMKAYIPPDCLAFQTGETLELLTDGKLSATPHFVAPGPPLISRPVRDLLEASALSNEVKWDSGYISRETLACFLQPNDNEVVGSDGETFGAFTRRVLERYY